MSAVIFDLDDTLYPHVRYVNSGFCAVAQHIGTRFGFPVDEVNARLRTARHMASPGSELQAVCATYGLDVSLVPELVQVFRRHRPEIWLCHDVPAVLADLGERGFRTAVLTNGVPFAQAAKVRALGLHALVDHVIYADEYAQGGKPAAEPFMAALRLLEAAPQSAVMVGDNRVNDIEGARAVGMRTILLARGARPQRDGGADAVVSGLGDVPRIAAALVHHGIADAA
ncbi:MAG TPA: HAD family hydrolase [Vicinamibacterales bacterium]|nr:HAD family hydrolase [Vicinamibacterales bacterium]